jgi:hypothetical protein
VNPATGDDGLEKLWKRMQEANQYTVEHFRFAPERPFDGIIRYVAARCGGFGRLQASSVITAYASSVLNDSDSYAAANLLNHESELYFQSQDTPSQWICIGFHDMRVTPEYYTLQSSHDYGPGARHLKSWILEGSKTGEKDSWFALDMQPDTLDLTDKNARQTFRIANPRPCRVLRIRSLGVNHQKCQDIRLAHLELFGDLLFNEPFQGSF